MRKRQPNRLPSFTVLRHTRSTKIDDELAKLLEREARKLKRSESDIIRNALRSYFGQSREPVVGSAEDSPTSPPAVGAGSR